MKSITAGMAESNGSLLPGLWRDSLHVTCGLTACTPGSAPGPTLGNEYGKTFFTFFTVPDRWFVSADIDECEELRGGAPACPRSFDCVNAAGSFRCLAKCRTGHRRDPNTLHCEGLITLPSPPCSRRCIGSIAADTPMRLNKRKW